MLQCCMRVRCNARKYWSPDRRAYLVRSAPGMSRGRPSSILMHTKNSSRPKGANSSWSTAVLVSTAATQWGSSGMMRPSSSPNLEMSGMGEGTTKGNHTPVAFKEQLCAHIMRKHHLRAIRNTLRNAKRGAGLYSVGGS